MTNRFEIELSVLREHERRQSGRDHPALWCATCNFPVDLQLFEPIAYTVALWWDVHCHGIAKRFRVVLPIDSAERVAKYLSCRLWFYADGIYRFEEERVDRLHVPHSTPEGTPAR